MRVATSCRLQGMIRKIGGHGSIFDPDRGLRATVKRLGRDDPETVILTGIYHNLIRQWPEV